MIINELCSYYERLLSDPNSNIAPPNYSNEKIHFAIVINKDGNIVQFLDLRETIKDKFKIPVPMIVPASIKRSTDISPNFLWDDAKYVLGIGEDKKIIGHTKKCYESFKIYHAENGKDINDEGYSAFLKFLDKWKPEFIKDLEYKDDIMSSNIVFKLENESNYLHERPAIKELWTKIKLENQSKIISQCLVDGEMQPIAKVHPAIKGVKGSSSSGAALISFNMDSFTSYGKEQNINAPISEKSAFSYTTALNYLLSKESHQKIYMGDTTIVFWTERKSPIEDIFGILLDNYNMSELDNKTIFDFLNAIRDGKPAEGIDPNINFYILGMGEHKTRIFVRFWYTTSVGELEKRLNEYISDMEIEKKYQDEDQYPKIQRYMHEIISKNIREKKKDKKSDLDPFLSTLASRLLQSIFTGGMYPYQLLTTTINAIRADVMSGKFNSGVSYYRASLIKGYLTRYYRKRKINWEVGMSLNTETRDTGYLLGRLFAIIEKAQEDVSTSTTIKDKHFTSASATPRIVFPQIMKLLQYYLSNIHNIKIKIYMEKLVEEIMDNVEDFPARLSMEEQGKFMMGYYQQRIKLYTSNKKNSEEAKIDE